MATSGGQLLASGGLSAAMVIAASEDRLPGIMRWDGALSLGRSYRPGVILGVADDGG
jgi:hypothetical protein